MCYGVGRRCACKITKFEAVYATPGESLMAFTASLYTYAVELVLSSGRVKQRTSLLLTEGLCEELRSVLVCAMTGCLCENCTACGP